MENRRFDALTRMLATSPSRRSVFAGLGAMLGVASASSEVEAAPLDGQICLRAGKRCKGRPYRCCGQATCRRGRCRCKKRFKQCKGTCIARHRCCGGCGAGSSCVNGTCRPPGCGNGLPCRVFVTSDRSEGDLGGLRGADALCQRLADDEGLGGTYLAWLSTDTVSINDRFTNTANTGPYQLVDGTVIAADWAELTSGTLWAAIRMMEDGRTVASLQWTNTLPNGDAGGPDAETCNNWRSSEVTDSGSTGRSTSADANWTAESSAPCNQLTRLYCFEQG